MGKVFFRNNDQSLIRNFTYYVRVSPSGYVSKPVKCDDWFYLGVGDEKNFEHIQAMPRPSQLRLSGDVGLGGVALGALGMWFVMIATAFFL